MSSDESRDPRAMAHLWCRACNHCMHTSAHCKRHFKRRPTHQAFGVHCACCDMTYEWEDLVRHLNVRHAHQRAAVVDTPPSPRTTSPDRSCSVDSSPRFQPYSLSAGPRRRSGPLRAPHDPLLSQAQRAPEAALGAPPASPVSLVAGPRPDRRYHSGFSTTSSTSPTRRMYRSRQDAQPDSFLSYQLALPELQVVDQPPDTSSGSTVRLPVSTQPLYIPDDSWSLPSVSSQPSLPLEAYMASVYSLDGITAASTVSSPLTLLNTDDLFMGSSASGNAQTSDISNSSVASRASSVDTVTNRSAVTITSDTDATPLQTTDSVRPPALSRGTAVEAVQSPSPDYISDRQLLQMAIGQLLWTFGIISTHVRHTDPSDVADSLGRHLLQSHSHWLIPLSDAMNMPLTDIVAQLRPVWSQLYYSRR